MHGMCGDYSPCVMHLSAVISNASSLYRILAFAQGMIEMLRNEEEGLLLHGGHATPDDLIFYCQDVDSMPKV